MCVFVCEFLGPKIREVVQWSLKLYSHIGGYTNIADHTPNKVKYLMGKSITMSAKCRIVYPDIMRYILAYLLIVK